jgi:hypothetical protein
LFNQGEVKMEYAQTVGGGARNLGMGAGTGGNQVNAIEKPRLSQQLDQLEKVLTSCHHTTNGILVATDRILGPVPQDANKAPGKPPVPSAIEFRLSELIGNAEELSGQLSNALQRLNSAV